MQNRGITIPELVVETSSGLVPLRRVFGKLVSKRLTMEPKQLRLEVSQDMLVCSSTHFDLLNTVITADESWMIEVTRNKVTIILPLSVYCRGVAHHEYRPQNQNITKEYNLEVIRRLHVAVQRDLCAAENCSFIMTTNPRILRI